uniref:Uncharacterized protein n=1 Tax=Erpetoichthys calabaricus TaxID=27687 RepID=A0A8C4T5K9_ERPCA
MILFVVVFPPLYNLKIHLLILCSLLLGCKQQCILGVAHWYVFQRTRSHFESFKEGLGALEILEVIQHHPEVLKSVFGKGVIEIYSDVSISFLFHNVCFIIIFFYIYLVDPEAVSLEDLLIFIKGSDKIPPLGFCPNRVWNSCMMAQGFHWPTHVIM